MSTDEWCPYEITKLIKNSPWHDCTFLTLKEEILPTSPGIWISCPTRWTVRVDDDLRSIVRNCAVFQALWDESLGVVKDTEMWSRNILLVFRQMRSFLWSGAWWAYPSHSDNLSRTLQACASYVSAAEGQRVATMTVKTRQSLEMKRV